MQLLRSEELPAWLSVQRANIKRMKIDFENKPHDSSCLQHKETALPTPLQILPTPVLSQQSSQQPKRKALDPEPLFDTLAADNSEPTAPSKHSETTKEAKSNFLKPKTPKAKPTKDFKTKPAKDHNPPPSTLPSTLPPNAPNAPNPSTKNPNSNSVVERKEPIVAESYQVPKSAKPIYDLQAWTTCRKDCREKSPFSTTMCDRKTTARADGDWATFDKKKIIALRAWYSLRVLPDGSAVGDHKICTKLANRSIKHMPPLFPNRAVGFADKTMRKTCVDEAFSHFWFRVSFKDCDSDEDKIVHYKDLRSAENENKSHFVELFINLIHHMCAENANAALFLIAAVRLTLK